MRNIVNAILIRDDKVLLARRSAHRKVYPNCWSFPGGHVEEKETMEEALSREVAEEIGVKVLNFCRIAELYDPAGKVEPATFHIYAVKSWEGRPTIQDDEHTELRWFTLGDARSLSDLALEGYRPLFASLRTIGA